MSRIGDVLQPLLPEIGELGGNRSTHMTPSVRGDADAAGRGEALETRCKVNAVAVDVVRCDDAVAEVDADAKLDAAAFWHPGIPGENEPLHAQGAAYRVDEAA